ncbi:MAG: FAD-dependent monooxygenase [Nitratireductor sp.]
MAASRSIIVSGAGIAGLTAALALSRRGYRVEVHERGKRIETAGAGIQLSPNALRVFDKLNVLDAVKRVAMSPDGVRIVSAHNGKLIRTVPLGASAIQRHGIGYLTIHRSELAQALVTACNDDPDIELHTGSTVSDAVDHANGISAMVTRGTSVRTHRGTMMVFADGIHSAGRKEAFALPGARHSGFEAWRGMISAEALPPGFDLENTQLVWGTGAHAVLYPVRKGRYLNAVICIETPDRSQTQPREGDAAELMHRLRGWHKPFRQLFELAREWPVWPLLEMPPKDTWHHGRMVMIGDAAHGMLPFAAQGAAMGIEDAEVLAAMVERHGASEKALDAWENLRRKRVLEVAALARRNGRIYHMRWPGSMVRDLVLSLTSPAKLADRQAWIYDWKP